MMQPDMDQKNARLQLEIEEKSPRLQLKIKKISPKSEENMELKLGEKVIDKLERENPDLDIENMDGRERPGSSLSSV